METINKIHKYSCNATEELIYLKEYMIYEEENKDKYVLFNFFNSFNQNVNEIEFEITQYNEKKKVLDISTFTYSNFVGKKKSLFVPYSKMMILDECAYIEAKLISATFTKVKLIDGNLVSLRKLANLKRAEEIKEGKNIRAKFKSRKANGRSKIATFIAIPITLVVLAVGLVISFITSDNYSKNITKFVVDDVTYEVLNSKTVQIKEYNGSSNKLVIPSTVYNYSVTNVGKNAFNGSKIQQIEFKSSSIAIGASAFENCSELISFTAVNVATIEKKAFYNCSNLEIFSAKYSKIIADYAFYNCSSLKQLNSPDITNINSYAFAECKSLKNVYVPNAVLYSNAFKNTSLSEITYDSSNTSTFGAVLGVNNSDVSSSNLSVINCNLSSISRVYFNGINKSVTINYPEDANVEFGAFSDCGYSSDEYYCDGTFEVVKGVLTGISYVASSFYELNLEGIPCHGIAASAFSALSNVNVLTLKLNGITLEKGCLSKLPNLTELFVYENSYLGEQALANCSKLERLTVTANSCKTLHDVLSFNSSLSTIIINGNINRLSSLYLADLPYVKEIYINNISGFEDNVIKNCPNLTYLSMPYLGNMERFGDLSSLETLCFTESSRTTLDSYAVCNMKNLKEVIFPQNITSSKSNVISNCELESLRISNISNISMESGFIANSNNIKKLYLDNLKYKYSDFNKSYSSTKELEVGEISYEYSDLFEGCENIKILKVNGYILNPKGIFSNLSMLEELSLTNLYTNYFGEYFSTDSVTSDNHNQYVPESLKTIIIENCYIPEKYLYNCATIENVILGIGASCSSVDSFTGLINLKNFYSYNSINSYIRKSLENTNYLNSRSSINIITNHYSISSLYTFSKYTGIDYQSHSYTISYNNKSYNYQKLIITDLDEIFEYFNVNSTDYTISVNDQRIYKGYFNSTPYYHTISIKKIESIKVEAFAIKDIVITYNMFDDLVAEFTYSNGSTIFKYTPPYREGYIFEGWYLDKEYKKKFTFNESVSDDLILYAKWSQISPDSTLIKPNAVTKIDSIGTYYVPCSKADYELLLFGCMSVKIYDSSNKILSDLNLFDYFSFNYSSTKDGYLKIVINDFYSTEDKYIVIKEQKQEEYVLAQPKPTPLYTLNVVGNEIKDYSVPSITGYKFIGWYSDTQGGYLVFDADGKVVYDIIPSTVYALFEREYN